VVVAAIAAWLSFPASAAAQAAFSQDGAGRQFTLAAARGACIPFTQVEAPQLRDCGVTDFGEIGTVDGATYYYAVYCLIPSDGDVGWCRDQPASAYHARRGLSVFERRGQSPTITLVFERVSEEIGLYRFDNAPEIVRAASHTMLYLPIRLDGTGNSNESEYYLWRLGAWARIDSESWQQDFRRRIPGGLDLWKGIWVDVKALSADADMFRPDDHNCCPTGGTAHIQLGLRDLRLVLEAVRFTP
jgi:hypothetical protein